MKKNITSLLLLLLVAGGIAAVVFAALSWNNDPAKKQKAPETVKAVYMSTEGVEANIERRLGKQSGLALKARCPKKVNEAVGTTFRCSVRRGGQDRKIAIASVKINGEGGQFTWKSEPFQN